jgi:hypothetical protein
VLHSNFGIVIVVFKMLKKYIEIIILFLKSAH